MSMTSTIRSQRGFSLIELAVVLVVVGLMIGYLIIPLGSQSEKRYNVEAARQLDQIRQALYGFAVANGRLPCPADPNSLGRENPVGGSTPLIPCANGGRGFVPAATLGLSGAVNCDQLLTDPWGQPYRYSITTSTTNVYSNQDPDGVSFANLGGLMGTNNLQICPDAACANSINDNAVAVIYSTGKNWANFTSANENENAGEANIASNCGLTNYGLSNDDRYVSRNQSRAAGQEFDDIIIWIPPTVLFNKLLDAGQL